MIMNAILLIPVMLDEDVRKVLQKLRQKGKEEKLAIKTVKWL